MTPMRLAVYGYVSDDGGSLASAHPLVLKHLLDAGHTVDFYAIEGHNRSEQLQAHPNYRYLPITQNWILPAWRFVENVLRGGLRQSATIALSQISNAFFERAIARTIQATHRATPYDVLFVMGLSNPFGRLGIPTVSWTQGIASAERQGILSQRDRILRYCGRPLWWQLVVLYRYKLFVERRRARKSDAIFCGSEWAKCEWVKLGVPAERSRVGQALAMKRRPSTSAKHLPEDVTRARRGFHMPRTSAEGGSTLRRCPAHEPAGRAHLPPSSLAAVRRIHPVDGSHRETPRPADPRLEPLRRARRCAAAGSGGVISLLQFLH